MIGLKTDIVELQEYTVEWEYAFQNEKSELIRQCGKYVYDIQHIGSTAIKGCIAKPIIDIGIAIIDFSEGYKIRDQLDPDLYNYKGEYGISGRHYIEKGNKELQTHHIHIFEKTNEHFKNHILFRDYLIKHEEYIKEYCNLKKELILKYRNDREGYTESKNTFIKMILKKANEEFKKGI